MKRVDSFQGEYRWLSNFWPAAVMLDGMSFPTVEHAYQAAKCIDPVERRRISELPTPGQAKRAGREIQLGDYWERRKEGVMLDLLRQKFTHKDLREKLLATVLADLIEGNTWGDTYWGVCRGRGENRLGKLLMQVRQEIDRGAAPEGKPEEGNRG